MPATAVINARIQSMRLPRKLLLPLGGKTIIQHIIDRVGKSREIDEIIVASPDDGQQGDIERICHANGIKWVEGAKEDLPGRLHTTAENARNEQIIFLTGDLPFVSWEGLDALVRGVNSHHDYGNNIDGANPYLDGTNCEFVTRAGIERQAREATFGREHALIWLRQTEWEKKAVIDSPFSCAKVAHLPVMVDDEATYAAGQYIYTRLQGDTSYGALLWVMEKYMDDIERIQAKG